MDPDFGKLYQGHSIGPELCIWYGRNVPHGTHAIVTIKLFASSTGPSDEHRSRLKRFWHHYRRCESHAVQLIWDHLQRTAEDEDSVSSMLDVKTNLHLSLVVLEQDKTITYIYDYGSDSLAFTFEGEAPLDHFEIVGD